MSALRESRLLGSMALKKIGLLDSDALAIVRRFVSISKVILLTPLRSLFEFARKSWRAISGNDSGPAGLADLFALVEETRPKKMIEFDPQRSVLLINTETAIGPRCHHKNVGRVTDVVHAGDQTSVHQHRSVATP